MCVKISRIYISHMCISCQGPWVQRQIPNPKYFHDEKPLSNVGDIGAVGIEIWTMDEDMYFDNVVVTGDEAVAQEYRGKWKERKMLEVCYALHTANMATSIQ